jgi:hypothetical protein
MLYITSLINVGLIIIMSESSVNDVGKIPIFTWQTSDYHCLVTWFDWCLEGHAWVPLEHTTYWTDVNCVIHYISTSSRLHFICISHGWDGRKGECTELIVRNATNAHFRSWKHKSYKYKHNMNLTNIFLIPKTQYLGTHFHLYWTRSL